MNKGTILTISKSIIIILILLAFVFALRAPATDLNFFSDDMKADYIDSTGLPYFSEMDSYYNLRLTENYIDHGFVGDEQVNGSDWDDHRPSPDGSSIIYEKGISYTTSWLYNLANQFFGDYSVKEVAYWTGAIISSLAVIPAFIFSRRLTNDAGAIVATLLIVLAPNYFSHTYPGFFDTDMFYYIFSLFFILFFVESIRAKNIILKIIFAIFSVISIGLFSQCWGGYIFYVGVIGLFAVVYLIVCYIFNIGEEDPDNYSAKWKWFLHQNAFKSIVLLAVFSFASLIFFKGINSVMDIFNVLVSLFSLQSASTVVAGFPNVLVSVAEMQIPSMLGPGMNSAFLANTSGAVNGIGGISILFAALIVLYILVSRVWKYRSQKTDYGDVDKKPPKSKRVSSAAKLDEGGRFKISLADINFGSGIAILDDKRLTLLYATLFVVWVISTIVATTRGSRFITTLALPFALLTGMFVGFATDYIKNRLSDERWETLIVFLTAFLIAVPLAALNTIVGIAAFLVVVALGLISIYAIRSKSASNRTPIKKYFIVLFIVLALVTPTVCGAYYTADHVVPGTSDPMWNSMVWVNQNAPEDTVITSWWDFGYLFEIAADRQVTFDGGTQSGERAFWLGQAMTTDNLELSAGIFRMLDTTGDKAVECLTNYTGDTGKSTDILIDILPQSASNATNTLINKYHLTSQQAKDVIQYSHPANPRPVIFVASSDMLQKAGWWSYFGAWNFENQTSENFNYHVPTSLLEVKPGSSGKLSVYSDSGMTVNAVVNRGTGNNTTTAYTEAVYTSNGEQIMLNDTPYNPLNISNIIVIENGMIMKNESIKDCPNGNYTMLLMGNENQYTPILMSNNLTNSMFTRLFLLGGYDQDVFSNVHSETGVMLWQVNFNNTAAGKSI